MREDQPGLAKTPQQKLLGEELVMFLIIGTLSGQRLSTGQNSFAKSKFRYWLKRMMGKYFDSLTNIEKLTNV